MRIIFKAAAILVFMCPLLMGCGHAEPEKTSEVSASEAQAPPPAQPASQSSASGDEKAKPSPSSQEKAAEPAGTVPAQPASSEGESKPQPAATSAPESPRPVTPATEASTERPKPSEPPQPESPKQSPPAPKQATPKDVLVLKGSPLGDVKFEHKLHSQTRNVKCLTCHHASKPEKPASVAQQACTDCHTKVAQAPMKTKLQAAFHNPMATAGTCIDCHKTQNATGKKAPVKCVDCHKKGNA